MKLLSIGKVAQQAGVSVETIRFYERKGLIDEPQRKESGYRQYQEDDINKLMFIQHAKTLGFSLNEIRDLMSLRDDASTTSREIKHIAQIKLDDIDEKIRMLRSMRRTLKKLVDQCPGEGPTCECPILEALESGY
jgi:MerR family mercuric resistance operon transcriptional regulator